MPAPRLNINSVKNGSRMVRLTVGELPRPMLSVRGEVRRYRRLLEAAVIEVHGEVDVTRAHEIDLACQAHMHCSVCRWLLNHKHEKMSVMDIMTCSREMLRAKETRNKAIHALALDREPDYIDALYAVPDLQNPQKKDEEEEDDE